MSCNQIKFDNIIKVSIINEFVKQSMTWRRLFYHGSMGYNIRLS